MLGRSLWKQHWSPTAGNQPSSATEGAGRSAHPRQASHSPQITLAGPVFHRPLHLKTLLYFSPKSSVCFRYLKGHIWPKANTTKRSLELLGMGGHLLLTAGPIHASVSPGAFGPRAPIGLLLELAELCPAQTPGSGCLCAPELLHRQGCSPCYWWGLSWNLSPR